MGVTWELLFNSLKILAIFLPCFSPQLEDLCCQTESSVLRDLSVLWAGKQTEAVKQRLTFPCSVQKFNSNLFTDFHWPLTGWADGTRLGRLWKNRRSTLISVPVCVSDSTLRNTLLGGWARLNSWKKITMSNIGTVITKHCFFLIKHKKLFASTNLFRCLSKVVDHTDNRFSLYWIIYAVEMWKLLRKKKLMIHWKAPAKRIRKSSKRNSNDTNLCWLALR